MRDIHDQRNRVMTALGAKQEGLTIFHFLNKLIVSCKEAVRIPIFEYKDDIFFKTILIQLPCNPFKYIFVHMRQKKTFKVLSFV
jgi:hypothetical protein